MKNTDRPQPPAAPNNSEFNPCLRQAVVLIMTTGVSWLDLRLGITILFIRTPNVN